MKSFKSSEKVTNSNREKESISKEWGGRRNNETKLREYHFKRQIINIKAHSQSGFSIRNQSPHTQQYGASESTDVI